MKKILLIEDDLTFSMILQIALKARGYDVESADDGRKGLAKVAEFEPDLIVLDINLPALSGFDVAKRLKESDSFKDIPIIMLTALSQEVNIARGYSLGIEDYLIKPFPVEHIFLKIKKYLRE